MTGQPSVAEQGGKAGRKPPPVDAVGRSASHSAKKGVTKAAAEGTGTAKPAEEAPATEQSTVPELGGDRKGSSGNPSVEPWEVPLTPRGEGAPPSETEKALLRVVKKLREVKAINARIEAGDPVEVSQHAKASRREVLLAEWAALRSDVAWEREHGGCSAGFVKVLPGVPASRLRMEAAELVTDATEGRHAQEPREAPNGGRQLCNGKAAPSALLAELAWAQSSQPPGASSSRRKKKGKAADKAKADDGGGWTVVQSQKTKRQQASEQEKETRWEAHTARQAMRVVSVESEAFRLTSESLKNVPLFTPADCDRIEELIEQVTVDAQRGLFKPHSVDLTPFRNKYFFGFAYTYGAQRDYPGAHGVEAVWPPEDTSEIPAWIREIVIEKLEAKRVVPKGWINSATINDYIPGGFIVSHVDPPHLFDRPIISVSFFSDCNLVFGARFGHPDEGPGEATVPTLVHRCLRGSATVLKGYSADKITHGIRSCDLPGRRASIILRRVLPSAPVLKDGRVVPLEEHLRKRCH